MDRISLNNLSMLFAVFLFVFSWSNALYNSLVSISLGLIMLLVIKLCIQARTLSLFKIPLLPFVSIIIFFGSVLIASIAIGDPKSIDIALKYIYWMLPMFLVVVVCKNQSTKEAIQWGLITSVIYTSFCSLYQLFYRSMGIGDYGERITGFYENQNFYAILLILAIPFLCMSIIYAVKQKKDILIALSSLLAVLMGSIALVATASRGSMLGLIIGFIIVSLIMGILMKNYKLALIALIIISGMGLIYIYGGNTIIPSGVERSYDGERLLLWQSSYHMWQDYKLYGVGLNNWPELYQTQYILPGAREPHLVMPHNNLAWYFSTTGTVGGVGFIFFLIGIFLFIINEIRKNQSNVFMIAMLWSFIGIVTQSMVDVGFTMKSSARLFFVLLGIAIASKSWNWYKVKKF